jgi:hypothetical protein
MDFHEVIKHNLKYVRCVCTDGKVCEGKCYAYCEEDEEDEDGDLRCYIMINYMDILAEDIAEITEVNGE